MAAISADNMGLNAQNEVNQARYDAGQNYALSLWSDFRRDMKQHQKWSFLMRMTTGFWEKNDSLQANYGHFPDFVQDKSFQRGVSAKLNELNKSGAFLIIYWPTKKSANFTVILCKSWWRKLQFVLFPPQGETDI